MNQELLYDSVAYRLQLQNNINSLNNLINQINLSLDENCTEYSRQQTDDYLTEKLYKNKKIVAMAPSHQKNKLSTVVEQSITQEDTCSPRLITAPTNQHYNSKATSQQPHLTSTQSLHPTKSLQFIKHKNYSLQNSRTNLPLRHILSSSPLNCHDFLKNKKDQNKACLHPQNKSVSAAKSGKKSSHFSKSSRISIQALKQREKKNEEESVTKRNKSKRGIRVCSTNKALQADPHKQSNEPPKQVQDPKKHKKILIKQRSKLNPTGRLNTKQNDCDQQRHQPRKNKSRLSKTNLRCFYIEKRIAI